MKKEQEKVEFNQKAHDKVADTYESIHSEIFNDFEQKRLASKLDFAIKQIESPNSPIRALDYGAGSGNVTRHLLQAGLYTTAADVSTQFLRNITKEHENTTYAKQLDTLHINGVDLPETATNSYDLITTYSVLHHIPDYIAAVEELIRVLKPGGVLFMDHEHSAEHWIDSPEKQDFLARVQPPRVKTWKRFLKWSNWNFHIRRLFNPRYEPEGDIHVWPDDHIEWPKIQQRAESLNCEVLLNETYLLYKAGYDTAVYNEYKEQITDMQVMILRKNEETAG